MKRFEKMIAAVTGGASGLGRASSLMFAEEGASVAIIDIDKKSGLEVVNEIENKGGRALFVECDLRKESEVSTAIKQVVEKFDRIDILHANAGIIDEPRDIVTMDFREWKKVMDINVDGMFLTAKYVIAQMKKQSGGSIVFTGSNWVNVCDPGFSSYAASKGAVVSFARALALDHAKDNIRINVVCPGNMKTPLLEKQLSLEEDPDAVLDSMGQVSTPEEVANLVLFLASDQASAMKGAAVVIDQGETLGYGIGLKSQKGENK